MVQPNKPRVNSLSIYNLLGSFSFLYFFFFLLFPFYYFIDARMRHLFDTKKEHKSIKLVKKLQEEADKEWENEITRRREQELNDEAIAKELQAQLELESSGSGSNANSPPPLPTKPRAYNSSINSKFISVNCWLFTDFIYINA